MSSHFAPFSFRSRHCSPCRFPFRLYSLVIGPLNLVLVLDLHWRESSYRFSHMTRTLRALSSSTKTSLRIDEDGLLGLQFLMPKPGVGGTDGFVEFRVSVFIFRLNIGGISPGEYDTNTNDVTVPLPRRVIGGHSLRWKVEMGWDKYRCGCDECMGWTVPPRPPVPL